MVYSEEVETIESAVRVAGLSRKCHTAALDYGVTAHPGAHYGALTRTLVCACVSEAVSSDPSALI